MPQSSKSWQEGLTLLMRLFTFVVALMLGGAFFLPWIRLDGEDETCSGAELTILIMSPSLDYLLAISSVQTGVLIGSPILIVIATIIVIVKYGYRKTSLIPTFAVLASSIAIIYATPDLTTTKEPSIHIGLTGIIVLSAILLFHQGLIKLRTRLYSGRKLPIVYSALGVITGSGYYRWSESKAR